MSGSWNKPPILGVDLGTSTCLACIEKSPGEFVFVQPDPNVTGDMMPSYFCNTESGPLIGDAAWQQLRGNRRSEVARCVKRFMRDPEMKFLSGGQEFTPIEISARYLQHLRSAAERQFSLKQGAINQAVITVPANFGIRERDFTEQAAIRAGLDPHLLDEPIAAAYGLELQKLGGASLAMVVDLGGGTLDVTLLMSGQKIGGHGIVELGRDGDEELGGDKWDEWLAKYAILKKLGLQREESFFRFTNIRLYERFEPAKRELSAGAASRRIQYEDIESGGPVYVDVTQEEFQRATLHLANRCVLVCDRLLNDISPEDLRVYYRHKGLFHSLFRRNRPLTWADIDQVYLVGGGGRVPLVRQVLREKWGRELARIPQPQHQVARGAAAIARHVENDDHFFKEAHLRSPHSYGFFYYPDGRGSPAGFDVLIRRNAPIPPKQAPEGTVPISAGEHLSVEIGEQRWKIKDVTNAMTLEHFVIGKVLVPSISSRDKNPPKAVALRLDYTADRAITITAKLGGSTVQAPIDYRGKKDERKVVNPHLR